MTERTPPGVRKRVLLSAYACSPDRGSEPGTGWHRAALIARHCETWVICRPGEYREEIERYLRAHSDAEPPRFVFVPHSPLGRVLSRLPGGWYLAYNLWQRRARGVAARLHREIGFDLVHHVTVSGFREPGYLWKLPVPFVWGPVAGTGIFPWRFLPSAGLRAILWEGWRNLVTGIQLRLSPRVRRAAGRAAVLLTANSQVQWAFRRVHGVDSILMPNTGAPEPSAGASDRPGRDGPLRLLWSGVHRPHKSLHLLLRALALVSSDVGWELCVLGSGPMTRSWRRLARRLDIDGRCSWQGWLPHEEALAQYDWADLFVLSSLRDACPSVVLEALGHGVPVLCLDREGAGDMVTEDCGVKVAVTTPDRVVRDMAGAVMQLARDRERLARLSANAPGRARRFLWSDQAERIVRAYEEAVPGRSADGALEERVGTAAWAARGEDER